MSFSFDEGMIHHYWSQGYVALRGIVPPSLVRDLRAEADKAREYTHEKIDPQVQRAPRIREMADKINVKPFQDYHELPELVRVLERLFGPGSKPGTMEWLTILIEPKLYPRHGGWHRDGVCDIPMNDQNSAENLTKRATSLHRPRSGNQVNCALYNDSCLWFVPGSHLRVRDLDGEKQTFCFRTGTNPFNQPDADHAVLERLCIDDCRAFPGAVQMHLAPGDYLLYRSQAWHCGLAFPSAPRATLHDIPGYNWGEGLSLASA